jgi:RHS repeat-associated protein
MQMIQTAAGTTTFNYGAQDPMVRLTSIQDGAGLVFPVTLNASGQIASSSDPQGHTTTFTYEGGDLIAVTDPVGKITRRFVDGAGRVRSIRDPLGRLTLYEYDAMNHLTRLTDPIGQTVSPAKSVVFQYDGNGNLATVTDSRHTPTTAVTSYHYDLLNRLDWRRDPLYPTHPQETFGYDGMGNLLTYTDRRGIITDFRYDALRRRSCVGYQRTAGTGDCNAAGAAGNYNAGMIQYGYDIGSRLTQAVDSVAGTVTRNYDDLDNLKSETTPQGTINYNYDAASRRLTMQVVAPALQPAVRYCYDGSGRVTKLIQGGGACSSDPLVNITYDGAGRRNALALSNALSITYGYDAASRISSLQYKNGASVLPGLALTYSFDENGNRIGVGSDGARTALPPAVSSATYDAADELKTWGAGSPVYTYDQNGNLTSDGVKTYTWNGRNQLASVSGGGVTASFQYDAFGRRVQKTIGTTTRKFVYDGLNAVQELDGTGAVVANLLTGLGLDETFTRTEGTDRRTLLPDALGSTVALSDDNGTTSSYTYEPYGRPTTVAVNGNTFQFTGRENDSVCQGGTVPGSSCLSDADCGTGGLCVRTGPTGCQGGTQPGAACTTDASCGTGGKCVSTPMYHLRARYYAPSLGRFISEDPLGFGGGDYNLFAYVRNNPIMLRDPTGLLSRGCASNVGCQATWFILCSYICAPSWCGGPASGLTCDLLCALYGTYACNTVAPCPEGPGGKR